jgi:hypothetical protein
MFYCSLHSTQQQQQQNSTLSNGAYIIDRKLHNLYVKELTAELSLSWRIFSIRKKVGEIWQKT